MKRQALALGLTLAVAATAGALAHTEQQAGIMVTHPWVASTEAGGDTTGHPTIVNRGESAIELVNVTSAAAERVHLLLDGQSTETVTIGSGETLSPKRLEIRFEGLKMDLPTGKALPVTLHFADREAMDVHMAIGRDTMNPQQVVELPQGHHAEDSGSHGASGHHED